MPVCGQQSALPPRQGNAAETVAPKKVRCGRAKPSPTESPHAASPSPEGRGESTLSTPARRNPHNRDLPRPAPQALNQSLGASLMAFRPELVLCAAIVLICWRGCSRRAGRPGRSTSCSSASRPAFYLALRSQPPPAPGHSPPPACRTLRPTARRRCSPACWSPTASRYRCGGCCLCSCCCSPF